MMKTNGLRRHLAFVLIFLLLFSNIQFASAEVMEFDLLVDEVISTEGGETENSEEASLVEVTEPEEEIETEVPVEPEVPSEEDVPADEEVDSQPEEEFETEAEPEVPSEDDSLVSEKIEPQPVETGEPATENALEEDAKEESEAVAEPGEDPDHLGDSAGERPAPVQYFEHVPFYKSSRNLGLRSTNAPMQEGDHPTEPGEVMLFKTATPVPGKVNTWDVKVRMEAKNVEKKTSIVLVIDRSGSMAETTPAGSTKLADAKIAANAFINALLPDSNNNTKIGVVSFSSHHARIGENYTTVNVNSQLSTNAVSLTNAVNGIVANGGTNTQAGIREAQRMLAADNEADNKYIVLLSDGEPTASIHDGEYVGDGRTLGQNGVRAINEATSIKDAGTIIYTVATNAGTSGNNILGQIASSPNHAVATDDSSQLAQIFEDIAAKILSAMKQAEVADPMGTGFEVMGDVSNITVSQGEATLSEDKKHIDWNAGDLTVPIAEGSDIYYAEMTYRVEINDDILSLDPPGDGKYFTNGDTKVTYIDVDGNTLEKEFPKPMVDPVLWIAEKVLVDTDGNIITPDSPTSAIFPIQVTGADYNKTLNLNPGEGTLRKLLTDLRSQQTYNVIETETGFVYGDVPFSEIEKKIEIKVEGGQFVETDQFTIAADENGVPNQDVYIKVTNTIPETSVKAKKVWDGGDEENRPATYFQLYRQIEGGTPEKVPGTDLNPNPVLVPESNAVEWNNLAQYDNNGKQYTFTVKEVNNEGIDSVPLGYVKSEEYDSDTETWIITNKYVPVTVTKTVTKTWDDDNNAAEHRPESVTITLYADGSKYGDPVVLNAANNWTYTWIDLPIGPEYTVKETPVPEYYSVDYIYTPMTLNNEYTRIEPGDKMEFTFEELGYPSYYVAKKGGEFLVWTMGQLDEEQKADFITEFKALNVNGYNNISLDNTMFMSGLEFSYEGMNISVPLQKFWFSYKSAWSMYAFGQYHDEVEVVNKYDPLSIEVTKTWTDESGGMDQPSEITIHLYQNFKEGDEPYRTLVLTGPDWKGTFENLPQFDEDGNEYVYTIDEIVPKGYEAVVEGYSITNIRILTTIPVEKTWEMVEGEDHPASITIRLYRGDKEINHVTLTEAPWSYTFTEDAEGNKLPKTNPTTGEDYVYTVSEDEVAGYDTSVDGYKITNTQKVTDQPVEKVWVNETGEANPTSVFALLLRDGVEYKRVELNAENGWKHTWTDLPQTDPTGKAYVYTVDEVEVPGYTKKVEGSVITNTREVTSQDVSKVWVNETGEPNPTSVTGILLRNGEEYKTIELNDANEWKHLWENLPKYDLEGKAYIYTVDEVTVPGYSKSIEGSVITNTRVTNEIEVTKTWIDESGGLDQPSEITINLYQNGEFYKSLVLTGPDWKGTFENLPQFNEDGNEYVYTIDEIVPKGYEAVVDGYSVTNIRILTTIPVEKTWDMVEGEEHPASITIRLYRDGEEINSITLEEAPWSYTFTTDSEGNKLPKTNPTTGKDYVYTVSEDEVAGYDTTVEGHEITNTQKVTKQPVEKTWVNETGEANPTSVIALLLRDGVEYKRVELNAENGWKHTWTDLPQTDPTGKAYVYTVDEVEVPGYTKTIKGSVITNTREVTSQPIEKVWVNETGEPNPTSVTGILLRNGEEYKTIELNDANEWKHLWENLPKYDLEGKEYIYTVDEVAVPGYSKSIKDSVITNTRVTNEIEVTKIWIDESGGMDQPSEITINLYQNGEFYKSLVLTGPDWKGTFENLPQFDEDGKEYVYTIDEVVPAGYEKVVDEYSVTNTRILTTIPVEKTWDMVEGEDHPASIIIRLYRDGEEINSITLEEAPWSYTFTTDSEGNKLPKTNPTTGKDYVYTVSEDEVAGYDTSVDGYKITNTQKVTDQPVEKVWVNETGEANPTSVIALLLRDGVEYKRVELNAGNSWKHTWTDLPQTDPTGKAYVYTVDEVEVPGYTKKVEGSVITNTREITSQPIEKVWVNETGEPNPTSVTGILLRNGEEYKTIELNDANEWKHLWENLPKYDLEGKEYTYTVDEVAVPGYSKSIEGSVITNSRNVTSQDVSKVWVNETGEDNPESIIAILLQNGEEYKRIELNAENNWAYTWDNLPMYDLEGNLYEYSVDELAVPGYTKTIKGSVITNTREVTSQPIEKVWVNETGEPNPISVIGILLRDGEEYKTIELSADNDWKYTWENLPKYDLEGKEYTYTIDEREVPGYRKSIDGSVITNTRIAISLEVTKLWEDESGGLDQPEEITINLYQNGEFYKSLVLRGPDWKATFENLPQFDENGEAYVYTIDEIVPEGYEAVVEGYSVTNTRILTTVPVTKVWDMVEGEEHPASITIRLYRDGKEINVITLTEAPWSYTFTEDADGNKLPLTNPRTAEDYEYTVKEDEVAGYDTEVNGYEVKNTQQRIEQPVEKVWVNETDEDNPTSVTAILWRNGEEYKTVELNQENNWKHIWTDLPKMDPTGKEYVYTVDEKDVPGYTKSIEGDVITNTRLTTSIDVDKVWEDEDGTIDHPDTITIELYRNDLEEPYKVLTLTAPDWHGTFENLPKTDLEGNEYTYTIKEVDPAPFVAIIEGNDEEGFTITNHKPTYTVEKVAQEDRFHRVGDIIHYTVTVVNTGKVAVEGLTIEDTLVPFEDMTLVESKTTDGVLEVGETWTLTYEYTVIQADVDRGYVLNVVSVIDPLDPEDPPTDEEEVFKPSFTVEKVATEESYDTVGDVLNYTVKIANTGKVDIEKLEIVDTLVPFEEMKLTESMIEDGILQVGEVWTLTYQYVVTQDDLDAGSVLNKVSVTDPNDPDNPGEDEVEVPGDKKPSMTIEKTVKEKKFVKVGDKLNYQVVVKNTGNVTLKNLIIEDTLVPFKDMKLKESMTEDGHLEVGETWTLTYTYTVNQKDVDRGYVLNKVTAKSPDYPDDPVEGEVKVPYEKPKTELPSTGAGSNLPLLFTGFGLLMVTGFLGIKRKRENQDK